MNLLNPTFDHVKQSPARLQILNIYDTRLTNHETPVSHALLGFSTERLLAVGQQVRTRAFSLNQTTGPIAKADCISLLTVWRPCSEPVMKGHLETVVLQKAVGYLAKFIVCQCHHSASTLMPADILNGSRLGNGDFFKREF
nr:hypothetical protein KV8917_160053 [Klebsiella variicola]